MSGQATDGKSLLERIGCMNGRSAGLVVTFGGGAPALTDRDISAAVGMARKRNADNITNDATCVRPELLQLHYASMMQYAYRVARATWSATCAGVKPEDAAMARRGCVIASESVGGRIVTAADVEHEAWSIKRRRADLEDKIGWALAWLNGELLAAAEAYCAVLRKTYEIRESEWREARAAKHYAWAARQKSKQVA